MAVLADVRLVCGRTRNQINMQSKDNLRKRTELTFGSKSIFIGDVCHLNELTIGRRVRVSSLFDLSERDEAISLKLHIFLINRNRGRLFGWLTGCFNCPPGILKYHRTIAKRSSHRIQLHRKFVPKWPLILWLLISRRKVSPQRNGR